MVQSICVFVHVKKKPLWQFHRFLPQAVKVTNPSKEFIVIWLETSNGSEQGQSLNQPQKLCSTAFLVQFISMRNHSIVLIEPQAKFWRCR